MKKTNNIGRSYRISINRGRRLLYKNQPLSKLSWRRPSSVPTERTTANYKYSKTGKTIEISDHDCHNRYLVDAGKRTVVRTRGYINIFVLGGGPVGEDLVRVASSQVSLAPGVRRLRKPSRKAKDLALEEELQQPQRGHPIRRRFSAKAAREAREFSIEEA